MKLKNIIVAFFLISMCLTTNNSYAQNNSTKLKLYGNVRIRTENDWNSQKKDGSMRDDRYRARFRLRLGFTYKLNDNVSFGGRLRSGNPLATQSPHINFGDELVPKLINIDKAYIKVAWQSGSFWAGKNSYPFWKQNELLWDDDATPEGIAIKQTVKLNKQNKIDFIGGLFLLDNNISNGFGEKAKFFGVQTVINSSLGKIGVQTALGYYNFNENTAQVDVRLQDLDYQLVQAGANISFPIFREKKIKLGFDLSYNANSYAETMHNFNQVLGYVASVKLGSLSKSGDWLLGYYFAHIEKYAVVPGYAQDDWVRWGSSTITRSSNFQGHEIRIAYAFAKKHNLVARLYIVDGIETEAGGTYKETGNRFRIDWNIGF